MAVLSGLVSSMSGTLVLSVWRLFLATSLLQSLVVSRLKLPQRLTLTFLHGRTFHLMTMAPRLSAHSMRPIFCAGLLWYIA